MCYVCLCVCNYYSALFRHIFSVEGLFLNFACLAVASLVLKLERCWSRQTERV